MQRLCNRRARGSVLIIVIVLLLLLAILGAAFISTSRSDRVNSGVNVVNVANEGLTTGIADAASGYISGDASDVFANLRRSTQFLGAYNPVTTYQPGNIVFDPNSPSCCYICIQIAPANTYPYNSPTFWLEAPYRGNSKGAYAGTAYNFGDVVSDNTTTPASYYVYINDNVPPPGATPALNNPAYWSPAGARSTVAGGVQPWIADRVPSVATPGSPADNNANAPFWVNLTQSVGAAGPVSIFGGLPFEDPMTGNVYTGTGVAYKPSPPLYPLFSPTGLPELSSASPSNATASNTITAASAGGDGVADSLLFRIPGAYFDGLTWYAGVRIIDDNSAINVNTAWSRDSEYDFTGNLITNSYYGLFPSSVGLNELLLPNDLTGSPSQPAALVNYRFGPAVSPTRIPYDETGVTPGFSFPTAHLDYQYITPSDSLYHELTRRLANPGTLGTSDTTSAIMRDQAVPWADSASIASHFTLASPDTTFPQSESLLEHLLPYSLGAGGTARTSPFNGGTNNDAAAWWNANFAYSTNGGVNAMPIRTLLTTNNPVTNALPAVQDPANPGEPLNTVYGTFWPSKPIGSNYTLQQLGAMMLPYGIGNAYVTGNSANYNHYKGIWSGTATYTFNDIVKSPLNGYTYIFVGPATVTNSVADPSNKVLGVYSNSTVPGNVAGNNTVWQFQPFTQHPAKANVNTATYRELLRAYWNVMAGYPGNTTPFGTTVFDPNPYDYSGTGVGSGGIGNFQHQCRSSLRDPNYSPANGNYTITPDPTGINYTTRMDSTNTMLLRSAIAAVNTLGLRDGSQNIVSRSIWLNAYVTSTNAVSTLPGPAALTPVKAVVYSGAPNPIISEVYADNYTGDANPNGYVAIELFNPYPMPIDLTAMGYKLGAINRASVTTAPYPGYQMQVIPITPGTMVATSDPTNFANGYAVPPPVPPAVTTDVIIPAFGYVLLENFNPGASTNASQRSPGAMAAVTSPTFTATGIYPGAVNPITHIGNTVDVYVDGLQTLIPPQVTPPITGYEFVLLRPRRSDGVYTACADPFNTFNEGTAAVPNLYDMVPVDSYDFTNLSTAAAGGPYNAWSYIRPKGVTARFKGTYPGRYDAGVAGTARPRQLPTDAQVPLAADGTVTTWTTGTPAWGNDSATGSYTPLSGDQSFPPIQVYNVGVSNGGFSHWPNPTITPTANNAAPQKFPFGGFARNGDILDVMYAGAYRISLALQDPASTNFIEMNSLPMDCSFADDGDAIHTHLFESVGRFCPMSSPTSFTIGGLTAASDYYSWTRNLFNFVTVQSNNDDYMPNTDPGTNDITTLADGVTLANRNSDKYWPGGYVSGAAPATANPPTQVFNADGTATSLVTSIPLVRSPAAPDQTRQDTVGVQGLININTASWKVLSMLPMVTQTDDTASSTAYITDNEALAQAIVAYRNANGPFTSIMDLNKVPGFQTANPFNPTVYRFANSASGPTTGDGLLSPPDPLFPSATGSHFTGSLLKDYTWDFLVLNRISNLITTKSDTFTVYVVVEGWQNAVLPGQTPPAAGLPQPQLKVVRRFAYIVNRSAMNADPATHTLKTLRVPND